MLFARSPQLAGLGLVVLDEVHYLQDPYRGSVWEEVLILSAPEVVFVCLSATVSNADEFGAWLRSVRGPTEVVVEEHRPVALRHHVAIAEKGSRRVDLVPLLHDGRIHPQALALDQRVGAPGPTARRPASLTLGEPPPQRARRSPRRSHHAPGHRLHLLEGGVRRRRGAMPVGRLAAHQLRGANRDPAALRRAYRGTARRRAAGARLRAVGCGSRGGHRIAPRRADPRLSRGRGGLFLLESLACGVRHRDVGARASTCRPARW